MGPFLANSFVIDLGVAHGTSLLSSRKLAVPYALLSRTLQLMHAQSICVQAVSKQGQSTSPANSEEPVSPVASPGITATKAGQTSPARRRKATS